jgi:hypothetical protein
MVAGTAISGGSEKAPSAAGSSFEISVSVGQENTSVARVSRRLEPGRAFRPMIIVYGHASSRDAELREMFTKYGRDLGPQVRSRPWAALPR